MTNKYSLVLTGKVSAGFTPETVRPRLAAFFNLQPSQLKELMERMPITIKQDADVEVLQTLQQKLTEMGALSQIHAPDKRPALYVQLDGKGCGPIPREMFDHYVEEGIWADTTLAAPVGSNTWQSYRNMTWNEPQKPNTDLSAVKDLTKDNKMLPEGMEIHAGFWRRLAAFMLDLLIFPFSLLLIDRLLFYTGIQTHMIFPVDQTVEKFGINEYSSYKTHSSISGQWLLIFIIIQWLYYCLMESSRWQGTLGKLAMGLKVVDSWGRPLGFGRATLRYLGKFISAVPLFIGFMLAGWTPRKQGLHDIIASTLVVFQAVEPQKPLPVAQPAMKWYAYVLNFLVVPLLLLSSQFSTSSYHKYTFDPGPNGSPDNRYQIQFNLTEAVEATNSIRTDVASHGCQIGIRPLWTPLTRQVQINNTNTGSCAIILNFNQLENTPVAVRNGQIVLIKQNGSNWNCISNISPSFLPSYCKSINQVAPTVQTGLSI